MNKEKITEKLVFYCFENDIDIFKCMEYYDKICRKQCWYYVEEDYLPFDHLASVRKDIISALKRLIKKDYKEKIYGKDFKKKLKQAWNDVK